MRALVVLAFLAATSSCADDAWREPLGPGGATPDAGDGGGSEAAAPLACASRSVSTLAGSSAGFKEGSAGPNGIARLDGVRGIAVFSTVLAFVADRNNQRVRNLLFDGGDCEVWAGSGLAGFADGAAEEAKLSSPEGVATDAAGTVWVGDTANHAIRRVAGGKVTTVAGDGSAGFTDGTTARFDSPTGVAVDANGNVLVADRGNHAIRRISPAGETSTLAGDGSAGFADGTGAAARFATPWAVAVDAKGIAWVTDTGNDRVRRVDAGGQVSTFAGGDGSLLAPMGIALDALGNVYVADSGHRRVVRLAASGELTILAGSGASGSSDGPSGDASFSELSGLAFAEAYAGGGLLVGDAHRVRLVHCKD